MCHALVLVPFIHIWMYRIRAFIGDFIVAAGVLFNVHHHRIFALHGAQGDYWIRFTIFLAASHRRRCRRQRSFECSPGSISVLGDFVPIYYIISTGRLRIIRMIIIVSLTTYGVCSGLLPTEDVSLHPNTGANTNYLLRIGRVFGQDHCALTSSVC